MKLYIAHKIHSQNKQTVKRLLTQVSEILEKKGHQTFIFYRDIQKRGTVVMTPKQIINRGFQELKKQDAVFAIVFNDKKSEGLLLEAGYAKALGKKIFFAVKKGCQWTFLKELADKLIEFEDISELEKKVHIK